MRFELVGVLMLLLLVVLRETTASLIVTLFNEKQMPYFPFAVKGSILRRLESGEYRAAIVSGIWFEVLGDYFKKVLTAL